MMTRILPPWLTMAKRRGEIFFLLDSTELHFVLFLVRSESADKGKESGVLPCKSALFLARLEGIDPGDPSRQGPATEIWWGDGLEEKRK